ncbi:copper chaperone [Flavobacterium sufflavum]|uniref:Copper chaperone n=1 Tax=Flavobacterium sufflavum TaxID=1921138 RepID=A0A3S3SYR5_9FLAO|nr:heavy-metal-associated domain-containing protein [Flavobacterium sufflavum]RVT78596.1 copper chaperone [Flavobacterium sufflavum]
MKSFKKIMIAAVVLLSISVNAQIKNKKTETVKISGNCEMCKKNIEKAGNLKKVALVEWDVDSKMAKITYDSAKTNPDEILSRIAQAGYDSEKFSATEEQYKKLHTCCQYDREATGTTDTDKSEKKEDHSHH